MKKILVVDGEKDFRKSLRIILEREGYTVLEAEEGQDGVSMFGIEYPDVVLLDLKMTNAGGVETMKRMKETNPGIPIIVLTASADIFKAVEITRQGAFDFIPKPPDFNTLLNTIRSAENKSGYCSLTYRELEILSWIARGKEDPEIGKLLTISKGTVHSHVTKILIKLDVKTRAQAVAVAIEKGIIKLCAEK